MLLISWVQGQTYYVVLKFEILFHQLLKLWDFTIYSFWDNTTTYIHLDFSWLRQWGNKERTDTETEKLVLGGLSVLMEIHKQPRNSVHLFYTMEWRVGFIVHRGEGELVDLGVCGGGGGGEVLWREVSGSIHGGRSHCGW